MDEQAGQKRGAQKKGNRFDGLLREPINSLNPLLIALIAHDAPNGAEAVWAEYYRIIAEQKQERLQLLAK